MMVISPYFLLLFFQTCHNEKKQLHFFALSFATVVNAQDVYKDQRGAWLQKAEDSKPQLIETNKQPVTLVKDENVFQHWKAVKSKPVDSLYNNSFRKQSGAVADFGEHLTGYFTFSVEELNRAADAPLRNCLLCKMLYIPARLIFTITLLKGAFQIVAVVFCEPGFSIL